MRYRAWRTALAPGWDRTDSGCGSPAWPRSGPLAGPRGKAAGMEAGQEAGQAW